MSDDEGALSDESENSVGEWIDDQGFDEAEDIEREREKNEDSEGSDAEFEAELGEEIENPELTGEFIRTITIVNPDARMTSNILSENEQTEIISVRTAQIARYNNCFVKPEDRRGYDDPVKLAKLELMRGLCPLKVCRRIGEIRRGDKIDIYEEEWKVRELALFKIYDDI